VPNTVLHEKQRKEARSPKAVTESTHFKQRGEYTIRGSSLQKGVKDAALRSPTHTRAHTPHDNNSIYENEKRKRRCQQTPLHFVVETVDVAMVGAFLSFVEQKTINNKKHSTLQYPSGYTWRCYMAASHSNTRETKPQCTLPDAGGLFSL
jgi:hypothetical protein